MANGPFNVPTGGNHDTLQFDTTILDPLSAWMPTLTARSATIPAGNGGTLYTLNDILTDANGVGTPNATFTVTGVSAGVVTSVSVLNPGSYIALNASSVPGPTTGGTGTGCQPYILWAGCGFVVPVGYSIAQAKANCQWTSNATGRRQLSVRKNYLGLPLAPQNIMPPSAGTDITSQNSSSPYFSVVAGDIITANVIQNSGGTLAITQSIGSWLELSLYP